MSPFLPPKKNPLNFHFFLGRTYCKNSSETHKNPDKLTQKKGQEIKTSNLFMPFRATISIVSITEKTEEVPSSTNNVSRSSDLGFGPEKALHELRHEGLPLPS